MSTNSLVHSVTLYQVICATRTALLTIVTPVIAVCWTDTLLLVPATIVEVACRSPLNVVSSRTSILYRNVINTTNVLLSQP
jgi:hypothetical protein